MADVVRYVKEESGRLMVTPTGAANDGGASVGVDAPWPKDTGELGTAA